jgi:hypothetical protein
MARSKRSKTIEPATPLRLTDPEVGPDTGGQSGDLQGLSGREEASAESVRELIEEGQFHEASLVEAIENAPSPDEGPLHPRRRSEDDLPPEYTDRDPEEPKE